MNLKHLIDLILLAMVWGASFLFMRISVPEFGAIPMMAVRVAIAGVCLLPLLYWKNYQQITIQKIVPISVVGIIGSAIPFCLIAYSTLYVTAGFASVVNAATPMCSAIIAFIWLKQKLSKIAVLGLFISLSGVVILVWDKIGFTESNLLLAVLAGLGGTFCYGVGSNFAKKNLAGVPPLAIASGSLLAGAVFLLPFAIYFWPAQNPSIKSWLNVLVLALACTAFAQILFFRLIENVGATNATTVTFLIPFFGLLWGYLFLGEILEMSTLLAGLIILSGTAMTLGLIKFKAKQKPNLDAV